MKKSNKIFPAPTKNKFFNLGSGILTAAIVLNSANVANALTAYSFSLSNENGPVNGTVEGFIILPDGDGTSSASVLVVTSAPESLGYTTFPFDVLTGSVFDNLFTVDGGAVDADNSFFESQFINNALLGLNSTFSEGGSYLTDINNPNPFTIDTGVLDSDSSTLTYSFFSSIPTSTFNFSFSNTDGAVDGTVEGLIELPDLSILGLNTFTVGASDIFVTSAPESLGYSFPLDVLTGANFLQNSFTIVDGMIEGANSNFFSVFQGNTGFSLNQTFFPTDNGTFIDFPGAGDFGVSGVLDINNSTLTYSSVNTPESTSIITLVGIGLLGVSCKLKKKL